MGIASGVIWLSTNEKKIEIDTSSPHIDGRLQLKHEFTYPSPIAAKIVFNSPLRGNHLIECHWIRPDGQPQENTYLNLDFGSKGNNTANLWLLFREESIFDDLKIQTSVNHKNTIEFKGIWTLKVDCDGHPVAASTFSVV